MIKVSMHHKTPIRQTHVIWHHALVTDRYGISWRAWRSYHGRSEPKSQFPALDAQDARNYVAKQVKQYRRAMRR